MSKEGSSSSSSSSSSFCLCSFFSTNATKRSLFTATPTTPATPHPPVCLARERLMRVFYSPSSQRQTRACMCTNRRTETIVAGDLLYVCTPTHSAFSFFQRFINFLHGGEEGSKFFSPSVFLSFSPFYVREEIVRIRRFIPFHSGMRFLVLFLPLSYLGSASTPNTLPFLSLLPPLSSTSHFSSTRDTGTNACRGWKENRQWKFQ